MNLKNKGKDFSTLKDHKFYLYSFFVTTMDLDQRSGEAPLMKHHTYDFTRLARLLNGQCKYQDVNFLPYWMECKKRAPYIAVKFSYLAQLSCYLQRLNYDYQLQYWMRKDDDYNQFIYSEEGHHHLILFLRGLFIHSRFSAQIGDISKFISEFSG